MASAEALDTQTRLTVIAGTLSGMPALSSAWRAVFWPRPAWMTLPKMTSSSWSPVTPARFSASFMATAPSSGRRRAGEAALEAALGGAYRGKDDDVVVRHCGLLEPCVCDACSPRASSRSAIATH